MQVPREISNLNQHPREGDGCCERVIAHDVINQENEIMYMHNAY